MKTLSVISEYNPFHLGHKLHLEKSMSITNATHSVAIMSSSFVQRGEPSIVDKWKRARMAIDGGFDLVIELPVVYSLQTAELFSYGAVKTLDYTNSIDFLSFGSEEGNLNLFYDIAEILVAEPLEYQKVLLQELKKGLSFPKAREIAINNILGYSSNNILNKSNNILAIEYIKALIKLRSNIKPITITRVGSNYNDDSFTSNIPSATAIRKSILKNGLQSVKNFVPDTTYKILKECEEFNSPDNYLELINYNLLSLNENHKQKYLDINDDLLNRYINNKDYYLSFDELVESLYTKNYTKTRIKRSLFHMLLDMRKDDIFSFINSSDNYIRILASNEKGFEILNKIKENSDTIIINNFSNSYKTNVSIIDKMLDYEIKATNLYNLVLRDKTINEDFTKNLYIKKS